MMRPYSASYIDIARGGFWSKDPPDHQWHHYQARDGRFFKDGVECPAYDVETIFAASEKIFIGP